MIEYMRVELKGQVWATAADLEIIKTCEMAEAMRLPGSIMQNKKSGS